jgi:hypothetical protein
MTVEENLEDFARRAVALAQEEKRASDCETRQRAKDMRSVLFMNAEGLIARNPRALKAKARMAWDEEWVQNPDSAGASLVRSLLRDLLQWEA